MDFKDYMDRLDVIPSRDERRYLKKIGYKMDDWQYATLIYEVYDGDTDKQTELFQKLSEETQDEELAGQLRQRHEYLHMQKRMEDDIENRFEYMTVAPPQPFDKGDFVRMVDGDEIGIVETSKEDWNRIEQLCAHGGYKTRGIDLYGEDTIKVDFLEADGHFSHDHISPVELERLDIELMPDSLDKRLLKFTSGVIKGDGELESFLHFYEERRKLGRVRKQEPIEKYRAEETWPSAEELEKYKTRPRKGCEGEDGNNKPASEMYKKVVAAILGEDEDEESLDAFIRWMDNFYREGIDIYRFISECNSFDPLMAFIRDGIRPYLMSAEELARFYPGKWAFAEDIKRKDGWIDSFKLLTLCRFEEKNKWIGIYRDLGLDFDSFRTTFSGPWTVDVRVPEDVEIFDRERKERRQKR